jgi:hypothetical protein
MYEFLYNDIKYLFVEMCCVTELLDKALFCVCYFYVFKNYNFLNIFEEIIIPNRLSDHISRQLFNAILPFHFSKRMECFKSVLSVLLCRMFQMQNQWLKIYIPCT